MFWKKIVATLLVVLLFSVLVAAFIYIPKYLDEEQRARDNTKGCKQYREFLLTAENWNKLGDTDQADRYRLTCSNFCLLYTSPSPRD